MRNRISIQTLRDELGDSDPYFSKWEVRGLVEAVEAAEERLETIYESRDPERMTQEAYFGLQELRARFDFGEET